MLTIYWSDSPASESRDPDAAVQGTPIWLDLIDPAEDERNQAAQMLGMQIPTREQTSARELSSRLIASRDASR